MGELIINYYDDTIMNVIFGSYDYKTFLVTYETCILL